MYKIYLKQAIELLKQNKFISFISITGTALAIMMVMVLILVSQVKNADVAPENNRSKLLYLQHQKMQTKDKKSTRNDALNYEHTKGLIDEIKSVNKVSAIETVWEPSTVQLGTSKKSTPLTVISTDANYWQIISHNFVAGRPFDQADFESGIRNAVITESVSEKLYGKENSLGKSVKINNVEYKITGVVKNVSKAFNYAYGEIWIPYTSKVNYKENLSFQMLFLTDPSKMAHVEQEVRNYEQKHNTNNKDWDLTLFGPYNHKDIQINVWDFEQNKKRATNRMIFLFSVLLLIPAINLSGLSLSRVRRRTEEIGIRKAFGANKHTILIQILFENFITSLLGGFIGLILSLITISVLKGWLLGATDASAIPLEALISIPAIIAVVVVSFILNLLSSGIPAWRASNMSIVNSLNRNNN